VERSIVQYRSRCDCGTIIFVTVYIINVRQDRIAVTTVGNLNSEVPREKLRDAIIHSSHENWREAMVDRSKVYFESIIKFLMTHLPRICPNYEPLIGVVYRKSSNSSKIADQFYRKRDVLNHPGMRLRDGIHEKRKDISGNFSGAVDRPSSPVSPRITSPRERCGGCARIRADPQARDD